VRRLGVLVAFLAGVGWGAEVKALQDEGGAVTGRIVTADTGEGIAAVAVALRSLPDSAVAATAMSGFDGGFRVTGVDAGRYVLEFAGLGYGTRVTEPFEVERGVVYGFGEVTLSVDAVVLDPIAVESERAAVSYEPDRTSYLVDAMPGAEGGTISDALMNVPELDVDIDGNIELHGERPAIWVNGRPAPVTGESLSHFLEQFPADLIERIEVLDAPGAEFDAEGAGGIVNLVLKEGVDLGVSGSVFANAGTRGNVGLGGRATMQRGDWVHNWNASLRHTDSEVEAYRLRQNLVSDPSDFIERDSWNQNASLSGSFGMRSAWTPRDEARLTLGIDGSGRGNERDGLVRTTFMDEDRAATGGLDRSDLGESDGRELNLRSGFSWEWERRRHTFDAEVRMGFGQSNRSALEEILADENLDDAAFVPAEVTLESESGDEREFRFDLDYRRPLGAFGTIRTGYSLRDDSRSNARVLTFVNDPTGDTDPEVTLRGHARDQQLNSAYLNLDGNLSERFSFRAGLRAEHVDWTLEFPGVDPVAGRYFDVFPSLNLSWRQDRGRRVRLSYSQRIGRPGVSVLDPTDRSTDPLQRNVGNPDIEPRYTHRVNLNASWSGHLGTVSVQPYLSRTSNGWERITFVDEDGVQVRTWDNVSEQRSVGGTLSLRVRRIGSWGGSVNLSGARSERSAEGLDARFARTSTNWNARMNLNGDLIDGLRAQASARYRASSRSLQGRDGSQVSLDLSFRYRFLQNRASASLSLRDPLALQRSETEIRDATIWEVRMSSRDTRSAQLSLSYALGGRGGGGRGR
jgi:hypothetical protein